MSGVGGAVAAEEHIDVVAIESVHSNVCAKFSLPSVASEPCLGACTEPTSLKA